MASLAFVDGRPWPGIINFGPKRFDFGEAAQPIGSVDVVRVHERDTTVLYHVAGKQHAVRLDHHHRIARRMRRAGIDQYEALATEEKRHPPVEGDIGRHNARAGVDPRRKREAPLVEPLLGAFAGGLFIFAVFRRPLLRDHDAGAVILERLQAVNVVGVIMADDIVSHRRGSDLFDGLEQIPTEARRAERVEYDDTVRGDDEAGIGGMALILLLRDARAADGVIDWRARNLLDGERPKQRRIRLDRFPPRPAWRTAPEPPRRRTATRPSGEAVAVNILEQFENPRRARIGNAIIQRLQLAAVGDETVFAQ